MVFSHKAQERQENWFLATKHRRDRRFGGLVFSHKEQERQEK